MISYARRFVDASSAEDIVQETFLKFYGKRLLQYTDNELIKIFYVTVRNSCIDYLRHEACLSDFRAKKYAEIGLDEMCDEENHEEEFADMLKKVGNIIELLPEKRRLIFKLYYVKGMNSKSIADMLSLSQRTVENNIYRALVSIRKILSIAKA